MTDFNTVRIERDPRGFVTLWLNRPEKNNAFNAEMIRELNRALTIIAGDGSLRFLVLRGHGRHFSAGADLAWMQHAASLDYAANLEDAQELADLMYSLHALPIPALAVVQGAAFGGAVGLVSCCDVALGTDDALFSLSEVRIGLAPAVISPFVVQAIGKRATRRYALTAERFTADEALALGLLCQCCPAHELDAHVEQWIDTLLLNSPQAMLSTKALLREVGSGVLRPELRRYTEECIARIRISDEGQEGLNAFLAKRTPAWQGQPS